MAKAHQLTTGDKVEPEVDVSDLTR